MTALGCCCDTDYVCRSSDRGCTSADVSTHCKSPCQNGNINSLCGCQTVNNRDHGSCKRDIINKCTCDSRYPYNNGNHYLQVAAADLTNKSGQDGKDSSLLQTTNNYEEQQCLVINLFQKVQSIFSGSDQCHSCDKYTDTGYGKSCLRMCYQKDNSAKEDHTADGEALLTYNCFFRIRQSRRINFSRIFGKLFAENKVKIDYNQHQCDHRDKTCVCHEICKGKSK